VKLSRGQVGAWCASTFDCMRNRQYRILWIGSALAFVGFMMSVTAQSVVAYELAGSNNAVGAVQFGQGVALCLLGPVAGALVDRLSKRLVLFVCQATIGLTMLTLAILIGTDTLTVLTLVGSAVVMGTMFAFLGPARQAYLGELVEPERRGNAVALTQVAMNATRVIGPFLAGALLAWRLVGPAGTYAVIAAVFGLVVATLARLPPSPSRWRRARRPPSVKIDVIRGLQHVTKRPHLRLLVASFLLVVMTGFPYMAILPGFATEELGAGTAGIGMLLGAAAAGGFLVSLLFASLADSPRAPLLLALTGILFGGALILTGTAPSYPVAVLTMVGVGAASSGFQTLNNALVMQAAEPAYYGRVTALLMVGWGINGLIALPVSIFADAAGERRALVLMGVAVCAATVLIASWATRIAAERADAVSVVS
jgi:MFS family permease